nr:hypothetical protein [Tanacetum cinerariifolium]
MANISVDIQCAGFDTRPPMLDRTDFASWQQRIRLYCRGPERPRVYSNLSLEEKDRYNTNIRATNILLQGLPKDIYTLINHYTNAKDIWDNHKGETIHDYYVRFAKLINEIRNIKMTMYRMQLNSKFVNNMLPEWGRFVIAVKHNRGLRDFNYDHLYAYLKQHETHANENKMMLDRFSQHTVDPLALMSNVSHQQHYSQSSSTSPSTYVPPHLTDNAHLDSSLSPTDNLIKNLTNTLAYSPNHTKPSNLKKTINSELHQIQGSKLQFKMAELWVDIIEVRGSIHGVEVQLGMGEFRTELGILIQVKYDRHKERDCRGKSIAMGANAQPVVTCYGCGEKGHTRNCCLRRNDLQGEEAQGRATVAARECLFWLPGRATVAARECLFGCQQPLGEMFVWCCR